VPEHNLIQAPEKLRRLFNSLGIRQPHIAPTMNEGVQPVVILDDVRGGIPAREEVVIGQALGLGTAGLAPAVALWNPPGTGRRLRLWAIEMSSPVQAEQWIVSVLTVAAANPITNPVAGVAYWEDLNHNPVSATGQCIGGALPLTTQHYTSTSPINVPWVLRPRAFYIHQGQAVRVFANAVGVRNILGSFEWSDEADADT
jgi:hypothetical protein